MKKEFKFDLGDNVYILGTAGMCIISARGQMNCLSGGIINLYQIEGCHCGYYTEHALVIIQEAKEKMNE
jgi:hypothetical protein